MKPYRCFLMWVVDVVVSCAPSILILAQSFNNHIAYLSWFVYPIIVITPFLFKTIYFCQHFDKICKYNLLLLIELLI